jgi:hypothetical protein
MVYMGNLISFHRCYTEEPIEFFVGPLRQSFYVPKHLLRRTPWKKADKVSTLPDVDIDTGHTLVHYLYTGAYQTLRSHTLEANVKVKRALRVYLVTITYKLPHLEQLATHEIEDHGTKLDICEILEAFKDDFAKLCSDSWVHGYLCRKVKAAFGLDHTCFKSDVLWKKMHTAPLEKFMTECLMDLYAERISQMINSEKEMAQKLDDRDETIQKLSSEKAILEQSMASRAEFKLPLAERLTVEDCCSQKEFEQETMSTEGFCTITCPSSECLVEPMQYPDVLLQCSVDPYLVDSCPDEPTAAVECCVVDSSVPEFPLAPNETLMEDVAVAETIEMASNRLEGETKYAQAASEPGPAPEAERAVEAEPAIEVEPAVKVEPATESDVMPEPEQKWPR